MKGKGITLRLYTIHKKKNERKNPTHGVKIFELGTLFKSINQAHACSIRGNANFWIKTSLDSAKQWFISIY